MRRAVLVLLWGAALVFAAPQANDAIAQALSQRQFDTALRIIDDGLKGQPSDARLWMMRGAALYGLRQPKDSLAAYRKAIQLQPNLMPALQAVAQLEYAGKDPTAAKTLAKILTLDP